MNQQGAHRYEDRLLEFAYGELPAAEARSIEVHVKGCARCTGALREIEGVRRQMSQLAPEPVPDAGLESLLAYAEQSARRAAAGPAPSGGWRRWLFAAVGTASLAAVLVVVGVVANRPDLKPTSPATIQAEEAKAQAQLRDQTVAATPPPAPAAAAPAAAAQPLAEGQANDLRQVQEKNKEEEADKLAKETAAANEAPAPEPKVGKAVGKGYDVQRVDVSTGSKAEAKEALDPRYRQSGADRLDTMQNMVPGGRGRPAVPTTGNEGYAQKTAQAADGEMLLSGDTKAPPAATKPAPSTSFRKKASAPTLAPKAKKSAAGEGSGGGLAQWDSGGIGSAPSKSSAGPSKGGAKDDSFDDLFGRGGGSKSSAGGTRGGGTARPSAPATPPASAPLPAGRAQLDAELKAKQRAAQQAEANRRDELLMEHQKAGLELERATESLEKKSVATRERPPAEPTPAPASAGPAPGGAPAPTAQAPSRNRGAAQSVAMNEPPPPPPQAAPSRLVTAPSDAEGGAAPAEDSSGSIPLSSAAPSPSSRKANVPAPSKVRTMNAQELFLAATKARPGSSEEINGLIIAINAGLAGQPRIDALQRLCARLDSAGDSRAYDYCSAWASADPSSAVAAKRAREADDRWGPRRARAAKKAVDSAEPDKAAPAEKAVSY